MNEQPKRALTDQPGHPDPTPDRAGMNPADRDPIERCPTCGMPRDEWPDDTGGGYEMGDTMHCCKGCATATGCTCSKRYTSDPDGVRSE